ncbi:MAG: winged helix-turn-helix transcriptional regulator [Candidatus Pacebacteria bacterium]|nr:winged helix-turn-helix transcriptional regulator [Candidatus Paceibacterota bacterium]
MRIFLVEDSAVARSVETMLRHSKFKVVRSELDEKEFSTVSVPTDTVLDLTVFGMSGDDAVRILRQAQFGANIVKSDGLVVNLDAKVVEVCGSRVPLSKVEYQILELLVLHRGTLVTKEMFYEHLQSDATNPSKLLQKRMCILRRKLATEARGRDFIDTVSCHGYILKDTP